jgi:hypothetical protein
MNGNLYKIKSKKSVQSLFPVKEEEMNAFVKNENIKFNSEKDLVKLFKYMNSPD